MLRAKGHVVNPKRVRRCLRQMGLSAIYQAPNTSKRHPANKVYPYLLKHLAILRPNQVWATDKVIFLLSIKAGLRSKEIAQLTWQMATDANGAIADSINLEDKASKGKSGRTIPINSELCNALRMLQAQRTSLAKAHMPIIYSERGSGMSASSITLWFFQLYHDLGFTGCSSHSGRRTFITRAARNIIQAGGSLRDVQQLAGHSSLNTTQRYIEGDNEAKQKVVEMV